MSNLGERLREYRLRKRVRQDELAEHTGVSVKTIQRWEASEAAPNANKMKLLADALDTTVAYLTGETDNPQRGLSENATWLLSQKYGEEEQVPGGGVLSSSDTNRPNTPRISQATLDLEAMIKDLAYEYPDLAIGFGDTRKNWSALSDNDKESIAEALMVVFKPESYVPKRLKKAGRCGEKV